jgi:DNA-directed RNA polymerase specialized sigma24 family protein
MNSGLAEQPFTPWFHTPITRTAMDASRDSKVVRATTGRPAAGLAGGDDEPKDER